VMGVGMVSVTKTMLASARALIATQTDLSMAAPITVPPL